jgi:hypothetical protein
MTKYLKNGIFGNLPAVRRLPAHSSCKNRRVPHPALINTEKSVSRLESHDLSSATDRRFSVLICKAELTSGLTVTRSRSAASAAELPFPQWGRQFGTLLRTRL